MKNNNFIRLGGIVAILSRADMSCASGITYQKRSES
jgi:hypothetical protein